ncbi:hypothetical protein IL54_0513 [Sphingobium sp. ba1]|nr:hypothetical protein IL54_0513 [Sphingobium sp. ba1]
MTEHKNGRDRTFWVGMKIHVIALFVGL